SQAPVSIVVFAKGAPLTVHATQTPVSNEGQTLATRLKATVTDAGASVPSSAVRWNWSFGDGASSSQAIPTHTFASGSYAVTVLVTDRRTGRGGTATVLVRAPAHARPAKRTQSGGAHPNKTSSPTGADASRSTQPGSAKGRPPATSGASLSLAPGAKPAAAAAPAKTSSSGSTRTHPAPRTSPRPSQTRPHRQRRALRGASPQTLVTGRLIADVTPLPAGSLPAQQRTAAPSSPVAAVRQASTAPASLSVPLGGLAVAALLALGAWRERRGLRRRERPRADY
ncbi:MAG TPA: PKD domain-containing protein, partial [Solirubrobacteraceae bacterium]